MKYKNIDSMLHNFGHSFCSLMNYVEGEYIIDLLPKVIEKVEGKSLEIHFPSGRVSPNIKLPEKLRKSVAFRSAWLPRHITAHKVDIDKVSDIRMKFKLPKIASPTARYGFECDVCCVDARGKTHTVRVNQLS